MINVQHNFFFNQLCQRQFCNVHYIGLELIDERQIRKCRSEE